MKHFALNLFLFMAALFAVCTAFPAETEADSHAMSDANIRAAHLHPVDGETLPYPPRFLKVLVLFSADTTKEDRDAFLAGLEEVRLRHLKDYHEIVRKWEEYRDDEAERRGPTVKDYDEAAWERFLGEQDFERDFYHNPFFLKLVDVRMVRTDKADTSYGFSYTFYGDGKPVPLWDLNSLDAQGWGIRREPRSDSLNAGGPVFEGAEALIVVASDGISAAVNRMIRDDYFAASRRDDVVVLFAGVSSFDESVREPQENDNGAIEPAKAPYAFAIKHTADPWPNTDLALATFPMTKKVILLTPEKLWNEEKETEFRAKLGPGKMLKTIQMPKIEIEYKTEADIATIKNLFAESVKAEIQPDTVIVSISSVEDGQDPVSWLPEKFDACPIFADTKPVYPSSVGGFCRSMEDLGVQAAELLDQLDGDLLKNNKLPPSVLEDDALWVNEAALKRYGLKASAFPESTILTNTNSNQAPRVRTYPTWTKKRILLLLVADAAIPFGLFVFALISLRAARRKRKIAESVYNALPVRILVMDRDGRFLEYHKQYGEVEQMGEFPWKNIQDVPWLQGVGVLDIVQEAFDSGKTIVRELEINGEPRVVVMSCTTSDVFGRPAVIAVSCDSPDRKPQA